MGERSSKERESDLGDDFGALVRDGGSAAELNCGGDSLTVLRGMSRSPVCFLICLVSIVLFWPSAVMSSSDGAEESPTAGPATDAAPPDIETSPPSVSKEHEFAKVGSWHATSEVNEKGESLTSMRLPADNPYVTAVGEQATPDLVVSCKRNNTNLYIDWKSPLGSFRDARAEGIDVEYTLDGVWPQRESWPLTSDKYMIVAQHPVDLIRSMEGKRQLLIQMTPYGLPEITVAFSLDSLDDVLKIIGERFYQ